MQAKSDLTGDDQASLSKGGSERNLRGYGERKGKDIVAVFSF